MLFFSIHFLAELMLSELITQNRIECYSLVCRKCMYSNFRIVCICVQKLHCSIWNHAIWNMFDKKLMKSITTFTKKIEYSKSSHVVVSHSVVLTLVSFFHSFFQTNNRWRTYCILGPNSESRYNKIALFESTQFKDPQKFILCMLECT